MINSEKVPSAFDMVDDMAEELPSIKKLEALARLFREGVQSLQDMRWGEMGAGVDYVPRLERHVSGETLQ